MKKAILQHSLKNGKKETILAHAVITPAQKGNIILPEQRGDYYVIRIHNGDNAPLKNIRLKWQRSMRSAKNLLKR